MIDDDGDIKQPSGFWDFGVVGIAAVLTFCGLALCFFTFTVSGDKAPPAAAAPSAQPTEVMIGVGQGSTIQPPPKAPAPAAHP